MATGARVSEILRSDYFEMRDLFARFAAARAEGRTELASEICRQLLENARVEEEIDYPAGLDLDVEIEDEWLESDEYEALEDDPDDITHDL